MVGEATESGYLPRLTGEIAGNPTSDANRELPPADRGSSADGDIARSPAVLKSGTALLASGTDPPNPAPYARHAPRALLGTLGKALAPATALGAMGFYFGAVRTETLYSYFGIELSTLGLSAQDYIFRSTDAVFVPMGAIALLGLVAIQLHSVSTRWLSKRVHLGLLRLISLSLLVSGLPLFLLGVSSLFGQLPFELPSLLIPLSIGLGIGLAAYGFHLRRILRAMGASVGEPWNTRSLASMTLALVWVLILLSIFMAGSEYARAVGRGRAEMLAQTPEPGVVVYSRQRLYLTAPGVHETDLGDAGAAYRFRYEGMRLLVRSGGRYFLLPLRWSPKGGTAIVLPENDAIRFEFTVGKVHQ